MTTTAARRPNAAARRSNATCAVCASPFYARSDAQLYCGADCRRAGSLINILRDQADDILAASPSATTAKAAFRLRRMLAAAVTGIELPSASEKADVYGPASLKAGQLRRRRWCACCGADLGTVSGRGRPPVSCAKATGRSCAKFRSRAQELQLLAGAVIEAAASPEQARRRLAVTVSEINSEIGR